MNFEELIKNYKPKLKAIAHKLDGRYTSFNDEDLYQEALLFLWSKYKGNELWDKTDSYILQGCFFEMKNFIRTHFRGVDCSALSIYEKINDEGDMLLDTVSFKGKEEEQACLEFSALLSDMKVLLNARQKKVFELISNGLTVREIAKILNVSHVMVIKIKKQIESKCKALKEEPENN